MIVIEPGRCRIAHTSKVTVSEIEQLLRLRDASVLHVVPRSIGDVHKYLSSENKLDNSGDSTVVGFPYVRWIPDRDDRRVTVHDRR